MEQNAEKLSTVRCPKCRAGIEQIWVEHQMVRCYTSVRVEDGVLVLRREQLRTPPAAEMHLKFWCGKCDHKWDMPEWVSMKAFVDA